MRIILLAAAAAALFTLASRGAQAMPVQALAPPIEQPSVTLVAQGCGIGFVRGPYGACRAVGVGIGVARPYGYRYGYGYRGYRYGYGYHHGYARAYGRGYARGFARGRR